MKLLLSACIIRQKMFIVHLASFSLIIMCISFFYCSKLFSPKIECRHIFETSFTSSNDYNNPIQDVSLNVSFTNPEGKTSNVKAFWDGGDRQ